ncbi:MAG: restriction endonuclease [Fimbriimonadales bacterium]
MRSTQNYQPTYEEWLKFVSQYWPAELKTRVAAASLVPRLLETQDKFLAVLSLCDKDPFGWQEILNHTNLGGNFFLKHLMVLADVGSELLQRLASNFPFSRVIEFEWRGKSVSYEFELIHRINTKLTNKKLEVHDLSQPRPLTPLQKDAAVILLYGGLLLDIPEEFEWLRTRCVIGEILGNPSKAEQFVKQRYIIVSRITQGSDSNALGQSFQNYIQEYLEKHLGDRWIFVKNGTIPYSSGNEERDSDRFDIVAKLRPDGSYCGIEISFQVTTNSVIERKANQAPQRYSLAKQQGHWIAYVIDGAGNIQRSSAVKKILAHSDCTVTLKTLDKLVHFLQEVSDGTLE